MSEIKNNGEQLEESIVQTVATDGVNGTELNSGSPLGKFKNAETLLDAYNELQSEFTRKCQKLSEAEKQLQELSSSNPEEKDEIEFAWKNKINEFLQTHKLAENFMEDISSVLLNDESLKNDEGALEKAYLRVMENKFIPQNELSKNEQFLDKYIFSNEDIRNKIISEYIESLQKNKSPLTINNSGFSRNVGTSQNINSLEDAKKFVEKMFKF